MGGFFTPKEWYPMVDKVEAKKNIERYETEITKWQFLSRTLMTRDEMMLGLSSKSKKDHELIIMNY